MSFSQRQGPPKSSGGHTPVPSNQSLLLEKVNARTSTPDSEALASSDDEAEQRHDSIYSPASQQKPARRSSWLNEPPQTFSRPRKESFASSTMSPTASHPSTPAAENVNGPWGTHSGSSALGRGTGGFSWGAGIWNNDRKDAPTRFSEVLPSPTSAVPPGGNGNSFFGSGDSLLQTSPHRDQGTNTQIPFAIPLHPTPKTYRSQSYSVGQLDHESNAPPPSGSSAAMGRRAHPALQHRPSRPSMLSEMSNDGSLLGKVKEVDDDEEDAAELLSNSYHQSTESQKIEMLTRENAMLRQQQYNRLRPRASTGASYLVNGYGMQEPVPEESDYAVDEHDVEHGPGDSFMNRMGGRRMSEYATGAGQVRPPFAMENRKGDASNLKRALWSSQLGFSGGVGGVGDVSQSRRHSFANMPTRQGSISSLAESTATLVETPVPEGQVQQDYGSAHADSMGYMQGFSAPNYGQPISHMHNLAQPSMGTAYPAAYGMQNHFPAPSPHRNPYAGMGQPRHNQPLYIVTFKCARADVFYIQEGTGLTVKPGDLVIVEADRGTDLGTVAQDNVEWSSAKELKEQWSEEHYKWLMMYSQGAAAASDGSGSGLMASSGSVQASAIGGMGPPNQHYMQEPASGELRPKLIKRLAQQHEILSLRDKEGQEAKAKRVCTTKVKEHGLNMEILDAEFQVDWKKLTFYYFADSYINFNSLVTDLFKIYKTRIWMSAINPASFASPTLGIQAPSGVGPGAVNAIRGPGANDRRQGQQQAQQQQQQQQQPQPQLHSREDAQPQAYGQVQGNNRNLRQPYPQPFANERNVAASPLQNQQNYGYGQGAGLGMGRPNSGYSQQQAQPSNMDAFGAMSYQQTDLPNTRPRFPTPGSVPSPSPHHSQGMSPLASPHEWTGGFQGLSLSNN